MTSSLILVVDDDKDVRESLRALLEVSGYRVKEYASAQECLDNRDADGDCLITDIRMPEMDGLALQAELTRRGNDLPVIFMTGHGDLAMAVRGMKAGALDFIEKPFLADHMLRSVASAVIIGSHAAKARTDTSIAQHQLDLLTARERDIFDKLVGGATCKSTAYALGISPRTVEAHRSNIMKKLRVRGLADLIRIACAIPASVEHIS